MLLLPFLRQQHFKFISCQHISVYLDTRIQVDKVLCDLRCCILEALFSPSCSFNKPSLLRMQENCRTWSRSPLLAPDSSAVRERLLDSSVLQVWRRENKGRGMRVQLTDSDESRDAPIGKWQCEKSAIEDGLKAEVAAHWEGHCRTKPHTLATLQQAVCVRITLFFPPLKAAMVSIKKTAMAGVSVLFRSKFKQLKEAF